jgi:cytochrome c1
VGARRTLAAATLANHPEAMTAWIADGHRMKPGNRMPSYRHLDGETVAAIATYLAGLE